MTRETDRAEIEALKRALDTALDIVDAERTKATRATVEMERALARCDGAAIALSAALENPPTRDPITHAIAYGLGVLSAGLVIWIVGVAL